MIFNFNNDFAMTDPYNDQNKYTYYRIELAPKGSNKKTRDTIPGEI